MQPFRHIHIISSAMLVFLFLLTACSEETIDSPPANVADGELTIAELRSLFQGESIYFEDNKVIYARVSMDESSGNIHRNVFLQDETAGINVRLDFAGNLRQGDVVRVALKGTTLGSYNNMLQLDSVVNGTNLVRQMQSTAVEPIDVTIPNILEGGYQAMLVRLSDVQFSASETGLPFANVAESRSENRELTDCSFNRIIVRTSPFATFANNSVPQGNGSLVGVVSQFGTTWQLLIRSMDEVVMEGDRCGGSGTFEEPLSVAQAIGNNTGNQIWVEGYIVGVIETSGPTNVPHFSAPFTTRTNILIADNPSHNDDSLILPVQLPIGRIRDALNLVENPGNLGKQVKIKGDLGTYFTPRPGLRDASGYWLDGQGIGDGGVWDLLTPISISEVRGLYQGTNVQLPANTMMQGIVISDRQHANIHGNNLVIVDENDGTGIAIRFSAPHPFHMGSKIRIDVSSLTVSTFNGLIQISGINLANAGFMEMTAVPQPEQTTIANLLNNIDYFESRLVKVNDVTITGGNTWNGTLTMNDGTASIPHFTTSYSTFSGQAPPSQPVTVTAIVTIFNNPQLGIRNLNDLSQ